MKHSVFTRVAAVSLVATGLVLCVPARADVVYNNSTGDLNVRFNPGAAEVGDEITLGGAARTVTNFTFQYWGANFSGDNNEQARIRFYANNGTNAPAGPTVFVPNSLLFDSGWFTLGQDVSLTHHTLIFDQTELGGGVAVPDSFTWSVQFQGVAGGESAGVDLFNPPTVGGNFNEYWDNAGSFDWQYRSILIDSTNGPANFGARVEAVPEPTALWLGLAGGLAALALRFRSSRR